MKTATASVVLPCSVDRFWSVYLDPAYIKALYLDELKYKGLEVLEVTATSRKLRVVPKLNMPGPIESLIGDSFAYEDHGTLNAARTEWTWRMVQPAQLDPRAKPKKDVVTTRGVVRLAALGENECRRSDELTIEAKIFGLGGLIESSAEKEARAAWVKEFEFLKRWVVKTP